MPKILIIEDDDAVRDNVRELLDAEGFDTEVAENGAIGLQRIRDYQPDIVICDVMMPALNGHQVLTAMRQDPNIAAIPFVFLTARADKADWREAMQLGADDFVTKPFTSKELLAAIQSRLARHATIRNAAPVFTQAERSLRDAMQQALEQNEFELYYQSQIDLKSQSIVGAEALIRWKHSQRGFVPPSEFIPVAEKMGVIGPIEQWVVKTAYT